MKLLYKILFFFLFLSCMNKNSKKIEENTMNILCDSILKEAEYQIKKKINDSLNSFYNNQEEEYLDKKRQVNFYKWKRKYLSSLPKSPKKKGFEEIIEDSFENLNITYIRNIELEGVYKGNDKVINDFFDVIKNCIDISDIIKSKYEIFIVKEENYFPVKVLDEDISDKMSYDCFCNDFNKAEIIQNGIIYSFDIMRMDCRAMRIINKNTQK